MKTEGDYVLIAPSTAVDNVNVKDSGLLSVVS